MYFADILQVTLTVPPPPPNAHTHMFMTVQNFMMAARVSREKSVNNEDLRTGGVTFLTEWELLQKR